MRRTLRILTAATLILAPGPVRAQEDLPGLFAEIIDVRVVNLEVVVTDRAGNRVQGLGPESFRLLVDGEEVPIDYFSEIVGGHIEDRAPTEAGPLDLPALAAGQPVGTSYLVFVDDFFSIARDRDRVLERLRGDLDRLGEQDRMAIVAFDGDGLEMISSWSSSPAELERAIREAQRRPAFGLHRVAERRSLDSTRSLSIYDTGYRDLGYRLEPDELHYARRLESQLMQVVSAASSTLRSFAMPPGRKVMLLFSGGWVWDPAQLDYPEPVLDIDFQRGANLYQPLSDTANLLGYTLYPIDVPGLQGEFISAEQAQPGPVGVSLEVEAESTLRLLARETGGEALINALSARPLERVWADTRYYYWLGYSPERSHDDRNHRIEVEVLAEGLRLRSRRSFLDFSRGAEVTAMAESTLLFGRAPSDGALVLEVGEIDASRRRMEVSVRVAIPEEAVTFLPTSTGYSTELELRIAVRDEDGGVADIPVVPLRFDGDREPAAGMYLKYDTSLTLRRIGHEIVVSVFDPASGRVFSGRLELQPPKR